MECGKQIVAPSCHGLPKSVSRLGDEWVENKACGKGERSQFGGWGPVELVSGGRGGEQGRAPWPWAPCALWLWKWW